MIRGSTPDVNSVHVGVNVLCFDLVFKSCCLGAMLVSVLSRW